MQLRRTATLIGLCMLPAAGCAPKAMPPIGPASTFQPNAKEQRIWQTADQDSRILQTKGILHEDPALDAYVNSVLGRLLKPTKEDYAPLKAHVYVIDTPVVNAFALPNGDIYVHTGILGRIQNEAQLAMLLGHEITHATNRHCYQKTRDRYARTAALSYVSVLSTAGGGKVNKLASGLSELVTVAGISGYSRDKERESDKGGLMLMARAGYDPGEGAKQFQNAMDASDPKELSYNALYATHPKMKERVEDCTEIAKHLPPDLLSGAKDKGADRYIAAAGKLIHEDIERNIAKGKYGLAEKTALYLLENKPTDAAAYGYLGEIYRARSGSDDARKAKDAYLKAIQIDANQPLALRGLGFLCLKAGEKDEAVRYLKAYIAVAGNAPDTAFVQQTVEKLETK